MPLHFSDLLYKDPDAAVCACMARPRTRTGGGQNHMESEPCTTSPSPPVQTSLGIQGCGLNFYSPLGTEVWGRSLLVFHSFDVTASNPCDFKVLRLAQGVKVTDEVNSQVEVRGIADETSSSVSTVLATAETGCDDRAVLNSESVQHLDELMQDEDKNISALGRFLLVFYFPEEWLQIQKVV